MTRFILACALAVSFGISDFARSQPLFINEFMADNDTTIPDPQGDYDDWLEIWNGGSEPVSLSGMHLTDDFAEPDKWLFPDTVLEAGAFILIWADDNQGDPGLHTNFKLSANGEQIGLFGDIAGGLTLIDSVTFGPQAQDVSFGRNPDGGSTWQTFLPATPGYSNLTLVLPEIEDLIISIEGSTAHLSWNPVPASDYYKIYRSNQPHSEPSPENFLANVMEPEYFDAGILGFTECFYYRVVTYALEPGFAGDVEMILPRRIRSGQPLPIITIIPGRNPRLAIWETFHLNSSNASFSPSEISLKRGRGSVTTLVSGSGEVMIELRDDADSLRAIANILIEESPAERELSGVLSGAGLIWDSTAVIHLVEDATVPVGAVLNIGSGTRIEIDEYVRLIVEGEILCQGTEEAPVLFTSYSAGLPWGEITHDYSVGTYSYTFLTDGGGDESQSFFHSGSQPIFAGAGCNLSLENVYIIDNPGKAMGISDGVVNLTSCLISRCDTGGELHYTLATIENTYFLDLPNDNGIPVDDDNDAIYLYDPWVGGTDDSHINNCVMVTGKDDGIDHCGANLIIDGCVIEDFDHEGVACSNDNNVEIFNTLIVGCEQGIEAGSGTPEVLVNHCTLIDNQIGLRLGDSYSCWESLGTLDATNSIVHNSSLFNVWNYDLSIPGPREGAITITYSIVNQPPYDDGEGCLTGTPIFTDDFLLSPVSIGIGAASDGLDIGLLPIGYDGFTLETIIPAPINERK